MVKLELQHTKDTIAHHKEIKELENERLRLELQLLHARNPFIVTPSRTFIRIIR